MQSASMNSPHKCPACERSFNSIFDYPTVRVLTVDRLPIPEAIDGMSSSAAEKRFADRARLRNASNLQFGGGINMTPAIDTACRTRAVQDYLLAVASKTGQEVPPSALLPDLPADRFFRRAYPVESTGIYLSLDDAEASESGVRQAEVSVYCEGPSLGSAGGPTLQRLGAIARLRYQGLLATAFRTLP
jgi:hypothetical protein